MGEKKSNVWIISRLAPYDALYHIISIPYPSHPPTYSTTVLHPSKDGLFVSLAFQNVTEGTDSEDFCLVRIPKNIFESLRNLCKIKRTQTNASDFQTPSNIGVQ